MYGSFQSFLADSLQSVRAAGLYKSERTISSSQSSRIVMDGASGVLNLCANNYLGLANHPEILAAAHQALDSRGYGLASVRFICGTQDLHRQLEHTLAEFLHMEDCILYSSCFDANGGLFEPLFGPDDAIISDELNHASIIDGVRLCKAQRYRYRNQDLNDLEQQLRKTQSARFRVIATDGVFSMDGTIADLKGICDLADQYQALVMVDDSHAVGFIGEHGGGTPEYCGVQGRVDILTGTLGKALGGASGGYTCARKEIVEFLRQRSRPYLFSNSIPPTVAAASLKALELVKQSDCLRGKLMENAAWFRGAMSAAGFQITPGIHPIVPVMLGDPLLAQKMAAGLLKLGICVTGFSYPVVPQNKARIRVQISAAHSRDDLEYAVDAFQTVRTQITSGTHCP